MHLAEFERLVAQAVQDLPAEFREHLEDVTIMIEDWPDEDILAEAECQHQSELLGYYRGVPLTDQYESLSVASPLQSASQIFLFRQPILDQCASDREVRRCIRDTLHHEIAHHFGFDDDELEEMGVY